MLRGVAAAGARPLSRRLRDATNSHAAWPDESGHGLLGRIVNECNVGVSAACADSPRAIPAHFVRRAPRCGLASLQLDRAATELDHAPGNKNGSVGIDGEPQPAAATDGVALGDGE